MSFREDYHRDMAVIHISETEAARDFEGLMERVRARNEVVIEKPSSVPVVLRAASARLGTPISELIEAAAAREKERDYPVYMDADFAADMEEIIRNRKPRAINISPTDG
jgi:hypothetical protein